VTIRAGGEGERRSCLILRDEGKDDDEDEDKRNGKHGKTREEKKSRLTGKH
jgi:hypothetical protein